MQPAPLPTKPHYPILDGLRGVAALMVVAFHLCEAHATSHQDQLINHGYLAVDFFFLLSGFVIGYAYDDRWGRLTVGGFFKRRLVRLQPLVVLGMVIGAGFFYFQESALWPAIGQTPGWKMLLVMLIGCFLVPVPVSLDVRGWHETFPLNGPGWSLFFEYVANVLYATVVRKFSNVALGILVVLAAGALLHLAVTSPEGNVIGGWSLEPRQLHIGFARMMYPFLRGCCCFGWPGCEQVSMPFGGAAWRWWSCWPCPASAAPRSRGRTGSMIRSASLWSSRVSSSSGPAGQCARARPTGCAASWGIFRIRFMAVVQSKVINN